MASSSPSSSRLSRVCTLPRSVVDDEVGPCARSCACAPQARGAEPRAARQIAELARTARDQGVAGIGARQHRREHHPGGQIAGHVLHRMHGEMGAAILERGFQLLDEQSLAADRREAPVQDLIALGGHRQELDAQARMGLAQQRCHVLRLPERELALARRDDERGGRAHEELAALFSGNSAELQPIDRRDVLVSESLDDQLRRIA